MEYIKTNIKDVVLIKPTVFEDNRGYFFESFKKTEFEEQVVNTSFIQDNESKSTYGVLRGLHYQLGKYSQSKLIRVISGRILDIAVDIREGSKTFGEHVSVELSGENKYQLFVPRGFAHGFVVLSKEAIINYKCDNVYSVENEKGLQYNDSALKIDWKLDKKDIILSEKDKSNPTLNNAWLFDIKDKLY